MFCHDFSFFQPRRRLVKQSWERYPTSKQQPKKLNKMSKLKQTYFASFDLLIEAEDNWKAMCKARELMHHLSSILPQVTLVDVVRKEEDGTDKSILRKPNK